MRAGPILAAAAAFAALAACAFLLRWWAGVRRLPAYDRPAATWTRWFRPAGVAVLVALALGGLAAAVRAGPWVGAAWIASAAAGAAAAAWRRAPARRRALLARRIDAWERAHPGEDPVARRQGFVIALHPEWGREFSAQLAVDCPDATSLARWIVRVEDRALVRRR